MTGIFRRMRADQRVLEIGLAPSRSRAQALILAGSVVDHDDHRITKPGQWVANDAELRVAGALQPYVSRGGVKLAHALERFDLDVAGRVALDVGASTGGFTDCLLQSGVARVYAVDVGTNQLAWSLRCDPRVVVHERTHIVRAPDDLLPEPVTLIVVDVAFIGLHAVIPAAVRFAAPSFDLVALIKPQFEVGRARVAKGGIVRDPAARREAIAGVEALLDTAGLMRSEAIPSPITGSKGNREYLIRASRF